MRPPGALVLPAVAAPLSAPAPDPYPRIAFVARNDNPFDALGVGAIAGAVGGVIAITAPGALSVPAATVLTEFDPDLVIIAGGVGAVSQQVEDDVDALGEWDVERAAGNTRDETAREVARIIDRHGLARPAMLSTASGQNVGDLYLGGHLEAESATIAGVDLPQHLPRVWSERDPDAGHYYTGATNHVFDVVVDVPADGGVLVAQASFVAENADPVQPASFLTYLTLDEADTSSQTAILASTFGLASDLLGADTNDNEGSTSLTIEVQGATPVTAGTHHVHLIVGQGGAMPGRFGLPSITVTWYPTGSADPVGITLPGS